MDVADTRLCLSLHLLRDLDDRTLSRLLRHAGSVRALRETDPGHYPGTLLNAAARSSLAHWQRRAESLLAEEVEPVMARLRGLGAQILPLTDARYPTLLQTIYDPPPLLYLRGSAEPLQQPLLAVVGSRRASAAGIRLAESLAGAAACAGLNICSGLALGIDGAAHRGALAAEGGHGGRGGYRH